MSHHLCYIDDHCLDETTCRRIVEAMDRGRVEPAEVLGSEIEIDLAVRRADSIEVDDATLALVERLLDQRRSTIAEFFGTVLTDREGPSFLRYHPGGFYRRHQDRGAVTGWPAAENRQIAVIIFLNSSTAADPCGTFSGGALRRFAEESGEAVDSHPRAGRLIAFPADVPHEVMRVEHGTRDTIVDWFR